METSRRRFLTLAGTTGTVAVAGCSEGEAEDPNATDDDADTDADDGTGTDNPDDASITITQGELASTLDPLDHAETPTDVVVIQAYEGILFRDQEGEVIESIATDWERVDDETLRFEIRDGVTFHNGEELEPEDVAYSINRLVDPDVDIAAPRADTIAQVESAEVDEGDVLVHTDGLYPIVFDAMASYSGGYVMQESWVEDHDQDEVASDMNGTGPYQLESYEEDVEVVYSRYDDYWGDTPDIEEVTFNAAEESSTRVSSLLEEETDIITNVPAEEIPRVDEEAGVSVNAVESSRSIYCGINTFEEPFSSVEFRQALNYAIDLETIIDEVLAGFGEPMSQPAPEGHNGHNPDIDPYPYDPDEAEALVEESGFAGAEIELHTPSGRYLNDLEIGQAVAGYIDDLSNVDCSFEQRDFGSLWEEVGDPDSPPEFYIVGWGNSQFDVSQVIDRYLTSGAPNLYYQNDDVDDLIERAGDESDPDEREQLLQEASEILHEEAPWLYLHSEYSVYGVNDRIDWEPRADEIIVVSEMSLA